MLACVDHSFFRKNACCAATIARTPVPTMIVASAVSISVNARRALRRAGDVRVARRTGQPPDTRFDILKIGRMIAIAMKPTTEPITTIMIGSIMLVTALIASFSAFA